MRVIDGGCHADDQQQQHRRHHHHQQQQQQQQFRLQAATVDDRGGGGGRQRRSENFAEQTDMAETGTTATEVVVVTVADAFKENRNGPPPQSSSYVSMSAATCATAAPEYVASSQVQAVSSIPVGQLINVSGAGTFNVITADSLQLLESNDFKPLLCVDNSFSNCDKSTQVDGDTWQTVIQSEDGTFKPSHNVLKPDNPTTNNVLKEETDQGVSSPNTAPFYSYSEAAKLPVLPVQCETTNAELHKKKFGSGCRGKCIKFENQWYTPNEFEVLSGRASSKAWEKSIRYGGCSLQTLVYDGVLLPHAMSCICATCCDDKSSTGPVRLFNPYKRIRSKKHLSSHSKKKKIEDGITLSNDEDSCDSSIGISLDNVDINMKNDESILLRTEIVQSNDSIEDMFKKLESMSSRMIKMVHHFRNSMRVAKYKWSVEKQELLAKLKRANENSIQNSNDFDVETISSVAAGLQPSNDNKPDVKKCANCNRDAFAECSLCRRTPYCSTFCQSKDWNNHQVECIKGSIMVTVQTQG